MNKMIDDFKLVFFYDIDDFVYPPKAGMGGLIKGAESETMWQNVIKLKQASLSKKVIKNFKVSVFWKRKSLV